MSGTVRVLGPQDLEPARALRQRALRDAPTAFCSELGQDISDDLPRFRASLEPADDKALFGAFHPEFDPPLVGMCSLIRNTRRKNQHRASLFGMFVAREAEGRGLGRLLLEAALKRARAWGVASVDLSVTSDALRARRMYEAAGFVAWGTQEDALRVDGASFAETHLRWVRSVP